MCKSIYKKKEIFILFETLIDIFHSFIYHDICVYMKDKEISSSLKGYVHG